MLLLFLLHGGSVSLFLGFSLHFGIGFVSPKMYDLLKFIRKF